MGDFHDHSDHHRHDIELWIIVIQGLLLVMSEVLPFCKGSKNGIVQGIVKIITSDCLLTTGIPEAVEMSQEDVDASCDCVGVESAMLEV